LYVGVTTINTSRGHVGRQRGQVVVGPGEQLGRTIGKVDDQDLGGRADHAGKAFGNGAGPRAGLGIADEHGDTHVAPQPDEMGAGARAPAANDESTTRTAAAFAAELNG
jgi:hypothetical protein